MTTPSLPQLQLELAKLLPALIEIESYFTTKGESTLLWRTSNLQIKETEWLHICHLIEQGMTDEEHELFRDVLKEVCFDEWKSIEYKRPFSESAPWPLRAQALLKVKGITV